MHAVDSLKHSSGEDSKPFNLVVLDLNMPISDGYEACKNIIKLHNENDKIFKNCSKHKLNLGQGS